MNALRFASLVASGVAMIALNADLAQAQSGYVYPVQSYPVLSPVQYQYPVSNAGYSTQPSCTTGQCGVSRGAYTTNYGATPCATGNCPTGANSAGCRTICGPNGCQTVCPQNCGPNGCPPRGSQFTPSYSTAPATDSSRQLPTLNLDVNAFPVQDYNTAPAWNGNPGFVQPLPPSQFGPRSRGFTPSNVQNINNSDVTVRLY